MESRSRHIVRSSRFLCLMLEFRGQELKPTAVQQALIQLHEYLLDIARRLPPGIRVNTEAHASQWPRIAIMDCARIRGADLIVMATRSRPRASSLIFGSTTEAVVDSQVAPTLVVHPDDAKVHDQSSVRLLLTRRARIAMTRTWRA